MIGLAASTWKVVRSRRYPGLLVEDVEEFLWVWCRTFSLFTLTEFGSLGL